MSLIRSIALVSVVLISVRAAMEVESKTFVIAALLITPVAQRIHRVTGEGSWGFVAGLLPIMAAVFLYSSNILPQSVQTRDVVFDPETRTTRIPAEQVDQVKKANKELLREDRDEWRETLNGLIDKWE